MKGAELRPAWRRLKAAVRRLNSSVVVVASVASTGLLAVTIAALIPALPLSLVVITYDLEPWSPGVLVARVCALPLVLSTHIALARFVLRIAPPRIEGIRWWVVSLLFASLIAVVALELPAAVRAVAFEERALLAFFESETAALFAQSVLGQLATLSYCLLRHLDRSTRDGGKTVLFLRRFSSAGDRALLRAFLRSIPLGTRAALLVSTRIRLRDIEPILWFTAGVRLLHPFSSFPVILCSSSDTWRSDARRLMESAEAIVVDVTEASSSVLWEVHQAQQAKDSDSLVWCMERGASSPAREATVPRGHLVSFSTSKRAAAWHALGTGLLAFYWLVPVVLGGANWRQGWGGVVLALLVLAIGIQPSLSRTDRRRLRTSIESALAASPGSR